MAFLEVNQIRKTFDDSEVLKGISFTLDKGEVLAIIGPSGNGKTTLLRCLNYLEQADEGTVMLGGEVVFDSKAKKVEKKDLKFGLVFQNFNLFPQYNVLENVFLAKKIQIKKDAKAYAKQVYRAEKESGASFLTAWKRTSEKKKTFLKEKTESGKQKAISLIQTVGLEEKMNNYPCELSGGQCQRVAIARALMMSPEILCFDEPTSALDPLLTGEVLNVIKELKNKDRTMIIVTHEMTFARNVADKIMFMANGEIDSFGTPEEIFDNPKTEELKKFLAFVQENGKA